MRIKFKIYLLAIICMGAFNAHASWFSNAFSSIKSSVNSAGAMARCDMKYNTSTCSIPATFKNAIADGGCASRIHNCTKSFCSTNCTADKCATDTAMKQMCVKHCNQPEFLDPSALFQCQMATPSSSGTAAGNSATATSFPIGYTIQQMPSQTNNLKAQGATILVLNNVNTESKALEMIQKYISQIGSGNQNISLLLSDTPPKSDVVDLSSENAAKAFSYIQRPLNAQQQTLLDLLPQTFKTQFTSVTLRGLFSQFSHHFSNDQALLALLMRVNHDWEVMNFYYTPISKLVVYYGQVYAASNSSPLSPNFISNLQSLLNKELEAKKSKLSQNANNLFEYFTAVSRNPSLAQSGYAAYKNNAAGKSGQGNPSFGPVPSWNDWNFGGGMGANGMGANGMGANGMGANGTQQQLPSNSNPPQNRVNVPGLGNVTIPNNVNVPGLGNVNVPNNVSGFISGHSDKINSFFNML